MGIANLTPWLANTPFEPFLISLADGRSVVVDQPETIMLAEVASSVYVFRPNGQVETLAIGHITSVRSFS